MKVAPSEGREKNKGFDNYSYEFMPFTYVAERVSAPGR
jgi:hypothetical protein